MSLRQAALRQRPQHVQGGRQPNRELRAALLDHGQDIGLPKSDLPGNCSLSFCLTIRDMSDLSGYGAVDIQAGMPS